MGSPLVSHVKGKRLCYGQNMFLQHQPGFFPPCMPLLSLILWPLSLQWLCRGHSEGNGRLRVGEQWFCDRDGFYVIFPGVWNHDEELRSVLHCRMYLHLRESITRVKTGRKKEYRVSLYRIKALGDPSSRQKGYQQHIKRQSPANGDCPGSGSTPSQEWRDTGNRGQFRSGRYGLRLGSKIQMKFLQHPGSTLPRKM